MALRAVIEHPKFARLKLLVKANRSTTLGYLECLWHFCGRFTPQGNVGKYPVAEVEAWLEWEGEEGALIAAFVKAKWLDEHPTHGLIVHDWHKHADDATRMALKRSKLDFVTRPDGEATEDDKEPESPTPSLPCPDTIPPCSDGVATVSGLPVPVSGAVPVSEPEIIDSSNQLDARELSPEDGLDYWNRPETSQPMRTVACCLCRVAELVGVDPPKESEIGPHLSASKPCRLLAEKLGWDEAARLYVWVSTHVPAGRSWSAVWNNYQGYLNQMRNAGVQDVPRQPAPRSTVVRKETVAEISARRTKAALESLNAA